MIDLAQLTYELVKPHEGSEFRLDFENAVTVTLTLHSVDKLMEKRSSKKLTRDSFSLTFAGPANLYLPQGTYVMQHAELGSPLTIFIVPTGKDENGFFYEAVFT